MDKRDILDSPKIRELKAERRNVFTKKLLFFLIGFVATCAVLVYLLSLKQISINAVEVTGNKVIDAEDIQKVAEREISGKYLWIFSRKNIFFYPEDKIVNALSTEFKRLAEIEVAIKERNTLHVQVVERTPAYAWCGEVLPTTAEIGQCYFLDTEGYVFDEAPYFSGQVYFKFYGPVEGEGPAGAYFQKDYFPKLVLFKGMIEGLALNPKAIYVDNTGDAVMLLAKGKNATEDPQILFKVNNNLEKVAENLKAARDAEPLVSKLKDFYSSLLYIDLRFENKVYYLFK